MRGTGIREEQVARRGRIPGNEFGRGDQVVRGRCQSGHVQGLADVAGVLKAAGVMMKEAATRREVEQCGTRKQRN